MISVISRLTCTMNSTQLQYTISSSWMHAACRDSDHLQKLLNMYWCATCNKFLCNCIHTVKQLCTYCTVTQLYTCCCAILSGCNVTCYYVTAVILYTALYASYGAAAYMYQVASSYSISRHMTHNNRQVNKRQYAHWYAIAVPLHICTAQPKHLTSNVLVHLCWMHCFAHTHTHARKCWWHAMLCYAALHCNNMQSSAHWALLLCRPHVQIPQH